MRIINIAFALAITLTAAAATPKSTVNYNTLKYIGADGREHMAKNQVVKFTYSDELIELTPTPAVKIPFRFSHINEAGERVYYQMSEHLDTKVVSENKDAFIISENNGARLRQGTCMAGKTSWIIYDRSSKK